MVNRFACIFIGREFLRASLYFRWIPGKWKQNNCFRALTCRIHSLQVVTCERTHLLYEYLHVHLLSVLLHREFEISLSEMMFTAHKLRRSSRNCSFFNALFSYWFWGLVPPSGGSVQRTAAVSSSPALCRTIVPLKDSIHLLIRSR